MTILHFDSFILSISALLSERDDPSTVIIEIALVYFHKSIYSYLLDCFYAYTGFREGFYSVVDE